MNIVIVVRHIAIAAHQCIEKYIAVNNNGCSRKVCNFFLGLFINPIFYSPSLLYSKTTIKKHIKSTSVGVKNWLPSLPDDAIAAAHDLIVISISWKNKKVKTER